jgi:hypothetical protein
MTERITSVGGVAPVDRRERERRERDRRADRRALIATETQTEPEFKPDPAPARPAVHSAPGLGAAAFVAQQMGQKGQKRGLRGGPPVLDAARSAYLGTEYSGEAERRPAVGQAKKTDI